MPGLGPRSATLALRQSGPEGAAVAVANALRITVPSTLDANGATVAGTVDSLGGLTVVVPKAIRADGGGFTRTAFVPGPAHLTGDAFVRYMTGSFVGETDSDRDNRQQAGWRALLGALTKPQAAQALRTWTTDVSLSTRN